MTKAQNVGYLALIISVQSLSSSLGDHQLGNVKKFKSSSHADRQILSGEHAGKLHQQMSLGFSRLQEGKAAVPGGHFDSKTA